MITHPDPEQLSAYVDGELTGTDRDDLEQHLRGCSDCAATVRSLRATLADMRALPAPAPSEQESWALRAAITKARKRPARLYRIGAAAAGAAAVAVAVVAFGVSRTPQTEKATNSAGSSRFTAPVPAPAALAPVVQIDGTNYSSAAQARALMTSIAHPSAAADEGPLATGGTPSEASATFGSERKLASATDLQTYSGQIAECQSIVLAQNSAGARALAYVIGRYDKTPAFFLIYSVEISGKTKTEMWVVRQSDCYIRLFLAPQ